MAVAAKSVDLQEAIDVTHRMSRTFSLATRLLPPRVRDDVYLLYLVCRRLDDLVDGGDPQASRRIHEVRRWARGGSIAGREESLLDGLAARHPELPLDAVADFCDGQESDLRPRTFETEEQLDLYCYQVAGTVGRMMAAILGTQSPEADRHARALGIAMQRTNILRDLDEDIAIGRVYVPRATLEATSTVDLVDGDRSELLRYEIAMADRWYSVGQAGIGLLAYGARQVRVAALMYQEILRQIERDGLGAARPRRAVVPRSHKARILARTLLSA
ncbi:MAG: phytoene/squalene synthase family protein [Candidatus Dormiibacterota bacterium]